MLLLTITYIFESVHCVVGLERLKGVPGRWEAPEGATDRLCVEVGDGAFIEVSHPAPQGDQMSVLPLTF